MKGGGKKVNAFPARHMGFGTHPLDAHACGREAPALVACATTAGTGMPTLWCRGLRRCVRVTNWLFVPQGVNIGVPFHVRHDVRDQNHGNTLWVDPFVHIGYVNVPVHYFVVRFGIVGGL